MGWSRSAFDLLSISDHALDLRGGPLPPRIFWSRFPRRTAPVAMTLPEHAEGGESLLRLLNLPAGRLMEVRVTLGGATGQISLDRGAVLPRLRVVRWTGQERDPEPISAPAAPSREDFERALMHSRDGTISPLDLVLRVGPLAFPEEGGPMQPAGVELDPGASYAVHLQHPASGRPDGVHPSTGVPHRSEGSGLGALVFSVIASGR